MRGDQQRAGSPAAAADDDPALDDSVAERTALLRTPRPGTTPPGSVSGDAARLRSHSAASFSIDGEGGGHGHDAASLDGDKEEDEDEAHGKLPGVDVLGQLSLLGVAFIWGTYTPALRFLYQTPGPPSAAVLTGIRSTIQALTLVLPSLLMGAGLPPVLRPVLTSCLPLEYELACMWMGKAWAMVSLNSAWSPCREDRQCALRCRSSISLAHTLISKAVERSSGPQRGPLSMMRLGPASGSRLGQAGTTLLHRPKLGLVCRPRCQALHAALDRSAASGESSSPSLSSFLQCPCRSGL